MASAKTLDDHSICNTHLTIFWVARRVGRRSLQYIVTSIFFTGLLVTKSYCKIEQILRYSNQILY